MEAPIVEFRREFEFLSNYYQSPINVLGAEFDTIEHFFQAFKTINIPVMNIIRMQATPGLSKKMGRKIDLRPDWDNIKIAVMEFGLKLKFQNPELRTKLIATGNRVLIEGNTWGDKYWGVDSKTREGKNNLGKLLMKIRREIRDEQTPQLGS